MNNVSCPSCAGYGAAERAAIVGGEVPDHALDGCTCAEQAIDVLYLSSAQFAQKPQIGTPCRMTWRELGLYLSRCSIGETKDAAGAYSPGLYRNNVPRKSNLIAVHAIVVDIDQGDVDDAAASLAAYRAIIHETFSSVADAPRCHILIELAEPIDAATYAALHDVVRAHLAVAGLLSTKSAKVGDASRRVYAPVRRPGAGYRFRVVDGAPLDAHTVLAAQPLLLFRIACVLSRAGFSGAEIESELLPAFVAAAGEHRAHEGTRTIRDAVRARRGGA